MVTIKRKMMIMTTTMAGLIILPGCDGQAEDLLSNMVNIHHHHILILPHLVGSQGHCHLHLTLWRDCPGGWKDLKLFGKGT